VAAPHDDEETVTMRAGLVGLLVLGLGAGSIGCKNKKEEAAKAQKEADEKKAEAEKAQKEADAKKAEAEAAEVARKKEAENKARADARTPIKDGMDAAERKITYLKI
jgi:hypothetical protein